MERILVVEDQKIIALEIKEHIEDMGYRVVAMASSGQQAIDEAVKHIPDLVIMDIKLEGPMDGIEAAQAIKTKLDIPVIYLTAYADDKTLQRAKITEPYGYVVKPLEERELKSAIIIALHKNSIEKKLRESEIKYKTIVNSLEGYFLITDSQKNIIAGNRNTENTIGKIKSNKCYTVLYGSETPCTNCTYEKVLLGSTARIEKYDRVNDKWYYEITTPILLGNNESYYQHMVIDITERKKNEENLVSLVGEKEVMMREIHHRVKNNLQLILSLVRLQNSKSDNNAVKSNLSVIENRLNSMALVHEDLYSSANLTQVQFRPYVEKLIHHLTRAVGINSEKIKIKFDIASVNLSVDLAIPIGIIINELVTNSLKHAFNGNGEGNIDIKFTRDGNEYFLDIKDDGFSLPENISFEKPSGLGLQIVKSLCGQLSCKPEIIRNNGTDFRFRINAVNYSPIIS